DESLVFRPNAALRRSSASTVDASHGAMGAPTARRYMSAVWTGSEMITWGGQDFASYVKDGASYNPSTDTWTPLPAALAPSARGEHGAIWTGDQMIVWGGNDMVSSFGTGGRYVP